MAKNHPPRNPTAGFRTSANKRGGDQRDDDARLRPHVRETPDPKRAVVKDQRRGPERHPHVVDERGKLREGVRPPRDVDPEAGRAAAIAARAAEQPDESTAMSPPAPHRIRAAAATPPRNFRPRTRGRATAPAPARKPCFLSSPCPAGTRRPTAPPAARRRRVHAADEAVEREQIKQTHERLGALHDVVHRLGLQRMQSPQCRHREARRAPRLRRNGRGAKAGPACAAPARTRSGRRARG